MTLAFNPYPNNIKDLIAQLLLALDEAIANANLDKTRFTAIDGQFIARTAGAFTYTFMLPEDGPWEPASNTNVRIELDLDDSEYYMSGTIRSVVDLKITLVTAIPLPLAALQKITLVEEDTWLLQKLRLAVEQVRDVPWHMATKIFGLMPTYEERGRRQAHIATFTPDRDQARAIEIGMASERLLLIGPPGTGKTSTYAALALEYLLAEKTVLLVAHTNVALDHAVKRLLAYCEQSGNAHFIQKYHIVRVGASKILTDPVYRQVTLQGIVDEQLGPLAQQRDRFQQKQLDLEDTMTHLKQTLTQEQIEGSDRAALKHTLQQLQKRHGLLSSMLEHIAAEQRQLQRQIIIHARLIATTLTSLTTNPYLFDIMCDAVMIDEASMASMAHVLVAAERATQHVVLIGDPLQLAPIVKLKDPRKATAAAYWLGTDVFSHLGITLDDVDRGTHQVAFLSHQSRMVPEIAAPVSQFIYGGRLKNREDAMRVPLRLTPKPECPLVLVDTGDVDHDKSYHEPRVCYTKRPAHSSSKYNPYHIVCVTRLIEPLLPQLEDHGRQGEPQIGVVTPYKAQEARLLHALRARNLLQFVHVGTVHSFQSLEYPCVIFDIVEADGVPISRFLSDVWGKEGIAYDATRLINVAHSRAREKLIYVANAAYIRKDL